MFVGGCTMAEVAALRFLSQQVMLSFVGGILLVSTIYNTCTCAGGEQCGVPGCNHFNYHRRVLHRVSRHQVGGTNILSCLILES